MGARACCLAVGQECWSSSGSNNAELEANKRILSHEAYGGGCDGCLKACETQQSNCQLFKWAAAPEDAAAWYHWQDANCDGRNSNPIDYNNNGSSNGDPHVQGFHGHRYAYCEAEDGKPCQGQVFSMISEPAHAINARINRLAGPDAWPHAGTWMTGFGMRYSRDLSAELELDTGVEYAVKPDSRGNGTTRATVPADWAGVFAGARVNGADVLPKIGSGETLAFAGPTSVHFPASRHASDPTDGPVMIVTTPDMKVTFFLETEDITHLDFAVALTGASAGATMHGVLGQSLAWPADSKAAFEGTDMDYVVEGGLLGTKFKFGAFTGVARAGGGDGGELAARRLLLTTIAPWGAEPEALVGGSHWV
ncbi:MAG: hypothetical protein J3K34DRAFT_477042 [Monoraphidium minutum]|nr:MAG: hypothetical protein J3K34DRAFT_477042 [Monoraphidium minutum]